MRASLGEMCRNRAGHKEYPYHVLALSQGVDRVMDEATGRVGVRIVADVEASKGEEEDDGGGGEDETKSGVSKEPSSVVGLVISVKTMNLKKAK